MVRSYAFKYGQSSSNLKNNEYCVWSLGLKKNNQPTNLHSVSATFCPASLPLSVMFLKRIVLPCYFHIHASHSFLTSWKAAFDLYVPHQPQTAKSNKHYFVLIWPLSVFDLFGQTPRPPPKISLWLILLLLHVPLKYGIPPRFGLSSLFSSFYTLSLGSLILLLT